MSTGARSVSGPISINVSVPGSATRHLYRNGALVSEHDITGKISEGCIETRPASKSTKKDSSGWRPPTSWSHFKTVFKNAHVESDAQKTIGVNKWRDWLVGDDYTFSNSYVKARLPSLGTCVDRAINKALMQLSNQQADFGENYAEREQADRLIGERVNQYTSQLTGRYITRHPNDWRKVKAVSPFVRHGMKYPESWLAFQYGVLPLLSDIHGAYQLLKRIDKDYTTFRVSVKASVRNETVVTTTPGFLALQDFSFLGANPCDVQTSSWSGAFVRLDYCMVNPALVQLQQIGLVNPVLLAWNLLPYSFVLDWALPVGNYLQSWTAALGYKFLGGSVSTLKMVEGKLLNVRVPAGCSGSVSTSFGSFSGFDFGRTVLTSSPAPRLPHFKNPLSLHHTANALSLLAVAFSK